MTETPIEDLRKRVRALAEVEIAPIAADLDRDNRFPRELWPLLGDAGLLGLTAPRESGGAGLGLSAHLVVMEEISRASASVGLSYAAHSNLCLSNLVRHGNTKQRKRYAIPLCSGKRVGALAMSEPGAGSDVVGSMSCHASLHGDTWIANGSKTWITNAPDADVFIVYMRTHPGEDSGHGITAFIVESGMKGFRRGPPADKLGMRGSSTGELFFEDCEIPRGNVLGAPNRGLEILMSGLDTERVLLSGGPLGIMRAALDLVLPYTRKRRQFNRPIGSFELIQAKLADMYTALEASRAFSYHVAEAFDKGSASRRDAAACLLFASENAVRAAAETIQTLGARGYMNASDAGRLWRDAKVFDIGGGTNEIRRILIGRDLVGKAA
ncbi:MAG: acyl-CoA dehydrogenase family protein [Pseudomonadota bacterium]|nr:acyl-CoA dehydrogenase family protein [Pseudomonadota bacterium]